MQRRETKSEAIYKRNEEFLKDNLSSEPREGKSKTKKKTTKPNEDVREVSGDSREDQNFRRAHKYQRRK